MSVSITMSSLEDRIRRRAYELYQRRLIEGRGGDAVSDWLQAEKELPLHVLLKDTPLPSPPTSV